MRGKVLTLIMFVIFLFILQYMFMLRIQEDFNKFITYWNNHPLAAENNRTPLQMFFLHTDDINYGEPIDIFNIMEWKIMLMVL